MLVENFVHNDDNVYIVSVCFMLALVKEYLQKWNFGLITLVKNLKIIPRK